MIEEFKNKFKNWLIEIIVLLNKWISFKDKTFLNILALLIAGAGIFAVLTKFSVPQLNMNYWDENLHAVKKDIIENVMNWIFTILALFGLLIQAITIIYEKKLTSEYFPRKYIIIFLLGLLCMVGIVYAFSEFGRYIAKKQWWPEIIQSQSQSYKKVGEIIQNGWFNAEEFKEINQYSEEEKSRINSERKLECKEILNQIEDLLEVDNKPKTIKKRYEKLYKFFK